MRPALAIAVLLVLGGLALMTSQNPRPAPDDENEVQVDELPGISVTLLGSPRPFQRRAVPAEPIGSVDLLRPHRLTMRLPDGRSVSLVARSTILTLSHGIATDVYVRRPLEPVRFGEAVADLLRTMAELGIEPGKQMKEHLAVWPEDAPGFGEGVIPYDFKTGVFSVYDKIDLDIRVSPDPQGGWYYLMIFGATADAREVARAAVRLIEFDEPPDQVQTLTEPVQHGEGAGRRLPTVSVPLLGSVRDIEGINLHPALPELSLTSRDILLAHRLTIRLPDGRPLALEARGMAFISRYGIIQDVFVRRPLEPVPYPEAVADLRRALDGLGLGPDASLTRQVAAWPPDAPAARDDAEAPGVEAAAAISEAVNLRVRVAPDPRGTGWFALLRFGVTHEARKAAHEAAGTPATRYPADQPWP